MSCPYISVVTASGEGPGSLLGTAQALWAQTVPPDRFEWVVCLGAGGRHARDALQASAFPFSLRLVDADPVGAPAAARNACASRTCGSILLFAGAGWLPQGDSLAAHVAVQEAGLCLALGRRSHLLRALVHAFADRGSPAVAWSVPGSVFRAVGGFDETVADLHQAERRLQRRLRRAGLPVLAVEDHAARGEDSVERASQFVNAEDTT